MTAAAVPTAAAENPTRHLLDRVMAQLPVARADLRAALQHLRDCAGPFATLEDHREIRRQAANLLELMLPWPPEARWQRTIAEIMAGTK